MNESQETNLALPLEPAPVADFSGTPLDIPDTDLLLQGPPSIDLPPDSADVLRKSARSKLTLLTDKAVRTLDKGLDSKDLKVALSAAKEVLDRDGIAAPRTMLLDDSSGFSSSVLLGLLAGAAKVMGLPVDEATVQRTLMEAKVSKNEATFTMATESRPSPEPKAGPNEEAKEKPSQPIKNVTPPPKAKHKPKRSSRKVDHPASAPTEYPPEFLSALSGGK